MNKQRTQVIALVVLVIGWAVYWHFFIKVPRSEAPASKAAARVSQSETLLRSRFKRVRAEMDALYHYRLKPVAFDGQWNAFRMPAGMDLMAEAGQASAEPASKTPSAPVPAAPLTIDSAQTLLRTAVANMKIGGVVTLNGITELTVDGQLHREGDVFSTKIQSVKGPPRSVIILIRRLTTASVTLALGDAEAGGAELRVRLN